VSQALVDALVRGLEKHGGRLLLGAHVDRIVVEQQRAVGLALRNGTTLRVKQAVVSNASVWDTLTLVPEEGLPHGYRKRKQATPECASFMHLHLGIDAKDLPDNLACHYIVVSDWSKGVDAPQNVVLISIPSLLDPSLAPQGKHAIHVYTPGNEPYQLWRGLDRRSEDYAQLKHERAEVMWQGLERVISDVRSRVEVELVGTPLTHARFLRRHHGSYGPALRAGKAVFPGPKTPLKGLYCCGDSTFPGIGLPAVAASGAIAANTIAPVGKHLQLLNELGLR
ncbi:MAG: NAD(P)/FAD-dependent oxidoreductase, partial [Cyanobacteria bacterium P01_E01_bin.34]